MTPMEHRARYLPRAFAVVAVAFALGLVIVYVKTFVQHRVSPPSCTGIGFGCEPGPGAAALIWGVFAMLPATVVAAVLLFLSPLAPQDAIRRAGAYGVAGLFALAAIVVPFFAD